MERKLRSFELKAEFQKMSHEQLSDYKFLSEFIFNRVGLSLNTVHLKISEPEKLTCWKGIGLRQYPEEIAKLLVFLYKKKDEINSYFEFGVSGGGSFFVIDSFLRAVNPSMGESWGIDSISVDRHFKRFEEYKKINPQANVTSMDSRHLDLKKHYDFCFIDGGHNQVENDYLKVKNFAKIIAFHDIKSPLAPKVGKLWESLDGNKIEFINLDTRFPVSIGIGVILPKEEQMKDQYHKECYKTRYFKRHLDQYRLWENSIGKNIVNIFNIDSVIDLGCGVGSYLEGALQAGCRDIMGIEISYDRAKDFFVEEIKPYIRFGDATIKLNLNRTFDCVMSFEVAEHILPEETNGFVENITSLSNQFIILTAAPPGQGGTGHINLRPKDFWIKLIESKGFILQDQLVDHCISIWKKFDTPHYILRNLMIFKKEGE